MAKKRRTKKAWTNAQVESDLELQFLNEWTRRYPAYKPTTQYKFHPSRQFRFDFAWTTKKYAVEVQGYGPLHNSLPGMTQDYDKLMHAQLLNWRIIYITSIHLSEPRIDETMANIAKLLKLTPKQPHITHSGYVPMKHR